MDLSRKRNILSYKTKALFLCGGIIFVIFLWWILSAFYNSILIPSPLKTIVRTGEYLISMETYQYIWGTLTRLLIGFSLSFLFGCILGFFGGMSKKVELFLKPLIVTLRTLPTAAVILTFIALFSSKKAPYYIVFLVVFPLAYEAMVSGIRNISMRYLDPLRLEGLYSPLSIKKIIIPLTSPYLFLGLFQALGLAMKVEIMAEILSGDAKMYGLGFAIKRESDLMKMTNVFAISLITIILISLIEIALYYAKKKFSK